MKMMVEELKRAEINGTENWKTVEKISKPKVSIFEYINKIEEIPR